MPKRTLVIVEDSRPIRDRIRAIANTIHDIEIVGEAEDVGTAVELIECHRPDLVTLDLRLKDGGSGLTVLGYTEQLESSPRIVILSAAFEPGSLPPSVTAKLPPVLDKATGFADLATFLSAMPEACRESRSPVREGTQDC